MRRLSSLGSKQLAHRKGRSALTALGIALGVAILFGVLVANATTQSGVDRLVSDFTGEADVLVNAPGSLDSTLPARVVPQLRALPDVTAVVGSYGFRSALPDHRSGGEALELQVSGIELKSARAAHTYELVSGRFFRPGRYEVVIPHALATDTGLDVGERTRIATRRGVVEVVVVGVMSDSGAGRTNQGDVAFTSLSAARSMSGVGRVISGARLVLRDGVDVQGWIERHERTLGPRFELRNAESLARGFKEFLALLGSVFTIFAAMTLFVGAFLIYLTLSMAVIERTRVYGTLRALGATRAQVARVVLGESLTLGAVSTLAGLGLGLLIARGLIRLFADLFDLDLAGLTVPVGAVVAGIAVGLLTTLVSALIPARRAARLSPVVAMRGTYGADVHVGRLWILGAVFIVVGAFAAVAGGALSGVGLIGMLVGSVLLVPLLLRPLARVLGRITARIAPGAGDIAVLHLVKERSRSAYTLALIMVVMGMIFTIGGLQEAVLRQVDATLDRQFGADLFVRANSGLAPSFADELRDVEGVAEVAPVGFASAQAVAKDGEQHELFALVIEPDSYFEVTSFPFVEGTAVEAERALQAGRALLLPTSETTRFVGADGMVTLRTTEGELAFRVAGTYTNIGGPPAIVISLADARRYLGAGNTFRGFQLNVAQGASVAGVRARIEAQLAERYAIEVRAPSQQKQAAREEIGQFFGIFYAIVLVAALVGLLGLANTLAMSVLQRYREIGVLRAIGTTRAQVRRMVLVESATLGLVAFALSLPLGFALSVAATRGIEGAFGFEMPYVYPAGWVPLVAAFGIVVAMLAAVGPGRRAARLEVVSALQYE